MVPVIPGYFAKKQVNVWKQNQTSNITDKNAQNEFCGRSEQNKKSVLETNKHCFNLWPLLLFFAGSQSDKAVGDFVMHAGQFQIKR